MRRQEWNTAGHRDIVTLVQSTLAEDKIQFSWVHDPSAPLDDHDGPAAARSGHTMLSVETAQALGENLVDIWDSVLPQINFKIKPTASQTLEVEGSIDLSCNCWHVQLISFHQDTRYIQWWLVSQEHLQMLATWLRDPYQQVDDWHHSLLPANGDITDLSSLLHQPRGKEQYR